MEEFCEFIESAGLLDIPLPNRKFTYYSPDGLCCSRLDRFLVSDGWITKWPNTTQKGLPRSVSDHSPVMLYDRFVDWGPKPFRSLDCWFDHPHFREFVKTIWEEATVEGKPDFVVKEKLKILKCKLKEWNRDCFGFIDNKIDEIRTEVDNFDRALEADPLNEEESFRRKEAFSRLQELLKRKANLTYQKSRSKFIREGDTNSKFFHNSVKLRRKRNEIPGISIQGRWSEEVQEVKTEIFNHFSAQFSNEEWIRPNIDNIPFNKVSTLDNDALTKPFTEEEIKVAVWECGCEKSPGPDGFNFKFIKEFWDTLKPEICNFILDFHKTGKFVRGFNPSFMVLIPKVENPTTIKEYRPISLISSMYKILAKILAKRFQLVLHKVISEFQSAFIPTRSISDGILVTNEIIDEAKRERKGVAIFKVDFEKAFDSVQWSFLDHMLFKLGFCVKWRSWIWECISTASVSILVNGSPTKEFPMRRGLRQGDPLSPLLFLVVTEGLSGMINSAVNLNLLEGYSVGRNSLVVSHLQFADDTVLITKPSAGNIWALKSLLRLFELVSGLRINFNKSTLMTLNSTNDFLQQALHILHCKAGSIPFMYLGMPVGTNPARISTWAPLIEQLRRKLSSWKNNVLSFGGRIILLKSVISSLPLYFFSFYLAPISVINKLKSLQIRFLWGGSEDNRKTAWVKWDTICKPINCGGLGIKNLFLLNKAMLGKWRFKILADRSSLCSRVIFSKYSVCGAGNECLHLLGNFSGGSKWWADIGRVTGPSPLMSDSWFGKSMLRKIGNGAETSFWHNVWVGNSPLCCAFPRLFSVATDKDSSIAEKGNRTDGNWTWVWRWRRNLFEWENDLLLSLLDMLSNIQVSEYCEDSWVWSLEPSGSYSVKSAYLQISGYCDLQEDEIFKSLKCKVTPFRVYAFAWKALQDRIPTRSNLLRFRIIPPNSSSLCVFCNMEEESMEHLLINCMFTHKVWAHCFKWWGIQVVNHCCLKELLLQHVGLFAKKSIAAAWKTIWFAIIWFIWKHRNAVIFRNANPDINQVYELIRVKTWVWFKFRKKGFLSQYSDWCIDPKSCI